MMSKAFAVAFHHHTCSEFFESRADNEQSYGSLSGPSVIFCFCALLEFVISAPSGSRPTDTDSIVGPMMDG